MFHSARIRNPKGKGLRPSSSSRRNSLAKGTATRQSPAAKESPPTCFAFKKGVIVHLSVPFIKEGIANLGVSVRSSMMKRLGGKPKKRYNSVVVDKTLDLTQAEDEFISLRFMAKGNLQYGVSAIPVKTNHQEHWEYYCQEVPTGSRRSTICDRAPDERSHFGRKNKVDKAVEVRMLCRVSNSEVVQKF